MAVIRRRLIFWLIRAYVKKWGKIIGSSFLLGLLAFFVLLSSSQYIIKAFPKEKKTTVGLVGAHEVNNLPPLILAKLSRGLTKVEGNGLIVPDAAESWKVSENGKVYTFTLKDDIQFSDGRKLTSETLNYDFRDVTIERPDKEKIRFVLKDAYAPFLVTTSRPIFYNGVNGIGDYKIVNVKLNGPFIENVKIAKVNNKFDTETYRFYPTEDSLKHAFVLGEVTKAIGLTDDSYKNKTFSTFPNVSAKRQTNYAKLVTIFYNTQDSTLSDKKLRNGLSYAIPNEFRLGQRNHVPYPPTSEYFNKEGIERPQDKQHAKALIDAATESASSSAIPKLKIMTLSKYKNTAETVASAWKEIGVQTEIEEVDTVPQTFQIYLGDFNMPKDPDQYTLWHSSQPSNTNITRYKNLRIDKLLEDGRKVVNNSERKQLYSDFQKYLIDDSPATFLYFPYEYTLERQ